MFVTLRDDERIKLLPQHEPNLEVKFIGEAGEHPREDIIGRQLQMMQSLGKCFKLADAWPADIVQVLRLDESELLFYLQNLRWRRHSWRVFGIMVKPYFRYGQNEKVSLRTRLYNGLNLALLKRMLEKGRLNALFVHTEGIRDALIKKFGWKDRHQERIIVAPDPAEMLYRRCTPAEAREKIGLPQDVPLLLFFGVLVRDKGPDFLLEAARSLKQDYRLVIAGLPDFVTVADIDACRRQLEDPQRIISRPGYVPDDMVGYYFLAADTVVLPYRRSFKGTSGVLQLAAAAGKPVIVTDVGEIGRTVRNNHLGLVVEAESPAALREGIEHFLADRENITHKVTENALKYAGENHWEKFAEAIEAAYRRVDVG
jgi:glycosyltransferase involved in cell wall biosynthesis